MNALKELLIEDFTNAAIVENFRIASDGTLNKRDGFTVLDDLGDTIRGCCFDGKDTLYVVAGSNLYVLDGEKHLAGTLTDCVFSNEDEKCIMYICSGFLYIIGGGVYYRFDPSSGSLGSNLFYAPIIESESTLYPVEVHNLISSRVRKVAILSSSNTVYPMRPAPLELHSVMLDGVYLNKNQYTCTYNYSNCYITITDSKLLSTNNILIVDYTINANLYTPPLGNSNLIKNTYVYDSNLKKCVFLYCKDSDVIYFSEAKTDQNANTFHGEYFTEKNMFVVGDGSEKIITITRQRDRVLVITQKSTYYIVEDTVIKNGIVTFLGFHTVLITNELGVSDNSGTVIYDNNLYIMNALGLYQLSFNPVDLKYTVSPINIPDNVGLPRNEYTNARLHIDRINREVWCQNGDVIAVYSITNKKWYRFTGFSPSVFFTYKNATAFAERGRICVFEVGQQLDGTSGFNAFVETRNLDLGNIFAEKTVHGFGAAFERRDGAVLECILKSDKGEIFTFFARTEDGTSDTSPVVKRTHARLGNCAYVICRLTSPGNAAPGNVRGIMLSYRVLGGTK